MAWRGNDGRLKRKALDFSIDDVPQPLPETIIFSLISRPMV